jgi:hypothetical protein
MGLKQNSLAATLRWRSQLRAKFSLPYGPPYMIPSCVQ